MKSKTKGSLFSTQSKIIIWIIGISLLGGVVYGWISIYQNESDSDFNWDIYIDLQNRFRMNYPQNWTVVVKEDESIQFKSPPKVKPEGYVDYYPQIFVDFIGARTTDVLKQDLPPDPNMLRSEKEIVVNGISGVERFVEGFGICIISVYLSAQQGTYKIEYQSEYSDYLKVCHGDNHPEIFNRVLDTFHVTQ